MLEFALTICHVCAFFFFKPKTSPLHMHRHPTLVPEDPSSSAKYPPPGQGYNWQQPPPPVTEAPVQGGYSTASAATIPESAGLPSTAWLPSTTRLPRTARLPRLPTTAWLSRLPSSGRLPVSSRTSHDNNTTYQCHSHGELAVVFLICKSALLMVFTFTCSLLFVHYFPVINQSSSSFIYACNT